MSISNNIADLPTLPPFSYITDERLGSVDVNEADVLKYLRHVDYINLMVCADSLYKPLTKLFNFALLNGKYPSQ